jgi:small-conductance mechanosensitive channel
MQKIFLLLLLLTSLLFANDTNKSIDSLSAEEIQTLKEQERLDTIKSYAKDLEKLETEISKEQVWMKSYSSYIKSLEIRESLRAITKRIEYLSKYGKSISDLDEMNSLISKKKILASQIDELREKDSAPFSKLLTPPQIEKIPAIANPFDIFTGISLIKTLNSDFNDYMRSKEELTKLIAILRKEHDIYKKIALLDTEGQYKEELEAKEKQLERFVTALETIDITSEVYKNRLEVIEIGINKEIEKQLLRLVNIGIVILIVFTIFFLLKLIVKKYITDNDRFYMANKIITFANFSLIVLIVFFNYIENVSYLVTILGFASAGIAIAMKDWFMSILGWLVIVFGGSIHVGDRVRVDMEGIQYVGDVMDISLLRITILEDITLTTYMTNRRAGRIIFIPNNYVFTRMIANYSHSSLKTVWDGIDVAITFESNHKKAMHLCKEIAKKYSKGYTDITRKQLNKIRSYYSLKNTNVEPRVFSLIEPNGINISTWYLTNAYATLTLRSIISTEIIDAFNKEDDITIAYPTQKLHLQDHTNEKKSLEDHEVIS